MKNGTRFVTAKHLSLVLLVVVLAALTPLFLQSDNATHAQAPVSAVSDAPALTVVSASSTAVELSWTLVADAVSYDLRTWWDGADGWQRIDDGSLTDTSHTHDRVTAGRKYFYIVAGQDGNGRRGPWSGQVEVIVPGSDAPTPTPTSTPTLSSASTPTPTPTLLLTPTPTQTNPTHTPSPTAAASALSAPTLQAETGPGQITLSWGRFANADSYRLVVWDPAISDWVRIGGVLTGTSYTHSGLSAGTTYYFHILAVAAGRAVSDWSQQVSAVVSGTLSQTQTPTRIPLLSPTPTSVTAVTSTPTPTATAIALSAPSLQAEVGPSQITLTWGRVANADSYRLIFYDRAISDLVQIGGVLTGTSYTHGGLTAGTTNYYRILSVAAGGAVSNWSEHVSAVVSASTTPTSTVTATVTATPTATPTVTATPMVTVTPTLALTPTGTATRATTERGALVALYEATDGDNWTYSYNWLTEAPLSDWYDVETDDSGHVIFLAPTENNLRGSIPNLSALTELTWLGLGKNWLTGPIPELSAFSKLSVLNLNYNRLAGEIPDLGRLTKLMWLYLNDNDLTGEIPDLSALTNLTWLDLGYNRLTGPIPDLSNLRSLFGLVLRGNDLTGEIPDLSAHTDLEQLDLGGNDLTGEIPDLGALTNLEQLVLGGNDLTGEIPDLGDLTELTTLDLGGNDLTEGIPDLKTLTELTTLNLGSNDLSGEIPDLSALISLVTVRKQRSGLVEIQDIDVGAII